MLYTGEYSQNKGIILQVVFHMKKPVTFVKLKNDSSRKEVRGEEGIQFLTNPMILYHKNMSKSSNKCFDSEYHP